MSTKKKGTAPSSSKTSVAVTEIKSKGLDALRAVLWRRHVIIGVFAVVCVAVLLMLLIPLLPRTVKPTAYRVGDLELTAITEVVGYRKLLGMSESLSGLGRAEAGEYNYRAGKNPKGDIEKYLELLTEEYGAEVTEGSQLGETDGKLTVALPTADEGKQVKLDISYSSESYTLTVDEKNIPKPKPEKAEAKITPEEARDILLTLTKAETGFKSDISVYTSELEPDIVNLDGWDYYVFTVIADYSATRIEYRGTFYIACHDGAIMKYDKETDTASRIPR